jgi:hypothetical protein
MGAVQLSEAQAAALSACISSYCSTLPAEQQAPCLNQCAAKAAAMPSGVPSKPPSGGGTVSPMPVTSVPASAAAAMLPGPGLTDETKKYLAFGVGALAAIGVVYWYSKKKKG